MEYQDFRIPSGETVKLRGLSGYEVMLSRKKYADDEISLNAFMISCAMGISEGAALGWIQTHLAGDFVAVTEHLQVVSGLKADSAKQAVRDFEANPEEEFRVLPGSEAGEDGGSDAAGDVAR